MNRIIISDHASLPLRSPAHPRVVFPELPPGSMTAAVFSRLVAAWTDLLDQTSVELTDLRSAVRDLVSQLRAADASGARDLDGIAHG
ncbi:hypothetical protein M0E87_09325 [Corynebacterium sp. CCM 9185]|uniref:Uncharacterized protein n=1 Tax=Corynebacterium marambiense TaxID=2765364 RepID=A0ABS0VWZ8_9CORY|nr:hypothetical protein [Corynebacterium marambiense]MBI9001300.1 hypothetical protein [Corynebacterium marambiense]MCK7663855.1 hypothetical protein [Corynebacterium marambiense]MCX7543005.1 hypothetical protein [Corynebacterium marambiense]